MFKTILSKIPRGFKIKIALALAAALAIAVMLICIRVFLYNDTPKADVELLYTTLSSSSELTTAKLNLNGFAEYEDNGLPIINKVNFLMTFSATASIGINLKDVIIDSDDDNKVIWLTIPQAVVHDVDVDRDSIKFYSEKLALFNVNEKEDMLVAEQEAEKKAREQAETMGVIEFADQQAQTLIEGLLTNVVPDGYTFQRCK